MEPTEGYVKILGFKLFYRSCGRPTKGTILCLHGGPGATHDYLLSLEDLAQFGYRVVLIDQLGCGKSARPRGTALYTIAHNVEEVEGVRKALQLGKVHLVGSSYGGALAIATALKYQRNLRSLVITGGLASVPLTVREMRRLVNRLPPKTRATLAKYEAREDYENPEYLAAVDVFYRRHVCRLPVWPREVTYSFEHLSRPGVRPLPVDRGDRPHRQFADHARGDQQPHLRLWIHVLGPDHGVDHLHDVHVRPSRRHEGRHVPQCQPPPLGGPGPLLAEQRGAREPLAQPGRSVRNRGDRIDAVHP